jgi:alpha-glucosidase
MVFLGTGKEDVEMYRGNFKIEDYVTERMALRNFCLTEEDNNAGEVAGIIMMTLKISSDEIILNFEKKDETRKRFWFVSPKYKK